MKKSCQFFALSVAFLSFLPATSYADDWGCEVLLCLSNPAGPMAVSQCVPPITKLYKALSKPDPDPFPTCDMANNTSMGGKGGNYATPEWGNHYDDCPAGTAALGSGSGGVLGTTAQIQEYERVKQMGRLALVQMNPFANAKINPGIGEGSRATVPRQKICVGNYLGTVDIVKRSVDTDNYENAYVTIQVNVYDRFVHLDAHKDGFVIKVFQDNKLTRVVRPQL